MGRPRKLFFLDKKTGNYYGKFRVEGIECGTHGKRLKLCSLEEALYKKTKKGLVARSEAELGNYLNSLYNARMQELLKKAKEKKKDKGDYIKKLFNEWLDIIKTTKSDLTYKHYLYSIKYYLEANENHKIKSFKPLCIEKIKSLLKARGNKIATINSHLRSLIIFFNWAYEQKYIDKPIRVKKIPAEKKRPVTWSLEQEKIFFDHLVKNKIGCSKGKMRRKYINVFRAAFLAINTGMRKGEVWSLSLKNIDIDKKIIKIRSSDELNWKPKKNKERDVLISENLLQFLKSDLINRGEDERFFLDKGNGEIYLQLSSLTHVFMKLKKELNLPGKAFHQFRALFITRLLESGVDLSTVQNIVGHSDIVTTIGYQSNNSDLQKKAFNKLNTASSDYNSTTF